MMSSNLKLNHEQMITIVSCCKTFICCKHLHRELYNIIAMTIVNNRKDLGKMISISSRACFHDKCFLFSMDLKRMALDIPTFFERSY